MPHLSDSDLLARHRGRATWGERLVPLEEFRLAAARHGRTLSSAARAEAVRAWLDSRAGFETEGPQVERSQIEGSWSKVIAFGGVYNNAPALEALLDEANAWGAEAIYCLGDLGGFGPHPQRIPEMMCAHDIRCIQGNYEQSIATGAEDCACGYTDPRDNHYAALSYRYTAARTSSDDRLWMASLPRHRRIQVGDRELVLSHGSPRRVNEFLFETATPDSFLELLCRQLHCDGFLCTHTGLPWQRHLSDETASGKQIANVGALGRPANDGDPCVRYARIEAATDGPIISIRSLAYDHSRLANEMRQENLPQPFIDTIESGWWTTCLEVLPAKERSWGRF